MLRVCNENNAFIRYKQGEVSKEITPSGCIVKPVNKFDMKYRIKEEPK